MSRMAPASFTLFVAGGTAAAPYGPPAPARPVAVPARVSCPPKEGASRGEIVVCARRQPSTERLPLREERAEAGEAVHHPGEPPGATASTGRDCARPGSCEPSKAPRTWARLFARLRGQDPD